MVKRCGNCKFFWLDKSDHGGIHGVCDNPEGGYMYPMMMDTCVQHQPKNNPENHTIPPTTLRRNKNNSKQLTLFAGETIGNR